MKRIMRFAKDWLGWKKAMVVAPDVEAEFLLYLDNLVVGTLKVVDSKWQFEYSDEFKLKSDLRPIVEFPDLGRVYENEELWQFFASRIPSMEQPDVERAMLKDEIEDDDVIALLRRFGRRTITNPFELRYNEVSL